MSLNGLDDPAVIESYQASLAEAGGWFLLKYITRDTVALLARGTGGVAEIRITIDGYEEISPLYGFLQYRRRKIILKYVPEGISRLIQARITVQFQSILDKFTPNDAVFSLALSSELTESALSSACLLHTASGSMTSSSSSLLRQKLGEITEDVEECASPREETYAHLNNGNISRRESVFSRTSDATAVPSHHHRAQGSTDTSKTHTSLQPSRDNVSDSGADKPLPSIPPNCSDSQSNGLAQRHLFDSLAYSPPDSRKSSQSTRPYLRDLDSISVCRPKVKLGPRPSIDTSGRPRTAGSIGRSSDTRPVASLPAGVRTSTRKTGPSAGRPKSQPDIHVLRLHPLAVPPVPPLLMPPPSFNLGPTSRNALGSPKSVVSVPITFSMTPEKQRLMRALELRKKQMENRIEKNEKKQDVPINGPEEAVKSVNAEENKENIHIVEAELTTHQEPTEPISIEADTESHTESTPASQRQQHPPSVILINEKIPTPPSPDPSNPDSAVDVGATKPQNDQPTSSFAPHMTTPSSDSTERNSPTLVVADQCGGVEEDKVEEAWRSNQADPQVVETRAASDTQIQTSNNGSEIKHVAESTEAPTGGLKVSVVEVPSDMCSPEATPRVVLATPVNNTSPDSQSAPTTSEMMPTDTSQGSLQSITRTASVVPRKSTEDISITSISAAGDNDMSKFYQSLSGQEASASVDIKSRRKGVIHPIHIATQLDESDEEHLLSDDSFMEELGSATVQQAKPIAVPKTPTFVKNGELNSPADWRGSRAVSNPTKSGNSGSDVQALPIGRSASGSYYENQKAVPVLVAKKVNVSSGISKRIKALEMFTSREGHQPSLAPKPPLPPTDPSISPFEKFRKRTSISQPGLPPAAALIRSNSPSYTPSPTSPKERSRSPNPPIRVDSLSTYRGKSTSVSVTARIIRDPTAPSSESLVNPSEPNVLNLQRSPLIVESDVPETPRRLSTSTISRPEKRRLSNSSSIGSGRASTATGVPRSDSISSRLSVSSRSKHEGHNPHPSADSPHGPLDRVDEAKEEKKTSRKSRIIRRMSSITSNSRRGIINALSPTLKEEDSQLASLNDEDATTEPPQVIDIGEVNVQFPDTLLWKRRFMRIDDLGYLILTPGTIDGIARNIVKRYHLSEFRTPFLPDQDRQELPNSIVLDFLDGSTLQCACESRQGQNAILQILLEAHRSYHLVFPQQES
ncbi:hypothetical protein PABG_04974 [Paracoccidioides brasiliensis Pb03]|nr:hypothetical protein PABG_04974 [Paracoccidioides brasiliensis Pb03]